MRVSMRIALEAFQEQNDRVSLQRQVGRLAHSDWSVANPQPDGIWTVNLFLDGRKLVKSFLSSLSHFSIYQKGQTWIHHR